MTTEEREQKSAEWRRKNLSKNSVKADVIKSVCSVKMPCTCKRALEANGFIDCDNSCKQTVL